MFDTLSALG